MHGGHSIGKDDSDYLAFKETTWSYSKFVYRSTFLCEPVPLRSQPIQICCTTITNMETELRYVHLYSLKNLNANSKVLPPNCVVGQSKLTYLLTILHQGTGVIYHDSSAERVNLFVVYCRPDLLINMYCK